MTDIWETYVESEKCDKVLSLSQNQSPQPRDQICTITELRQARMRLAWVVPEDLIHRSTGQEYGSES